MNRRDELIDKLTSKLLTQFWMSKLGVRTPNELSKRLKVALSAPDISDATRLRFGHEKEWPKYFSGAQLPQSRFVAEIDRFAPGSLKIR